MNTITRIIICLLCLFVFLFVNGCSRHVLETTVETRFIKTKEPASGSLKQVHAYKLRWPPPQQFEPVVIDNGVFKTKMLCDFPIFLDFKLPTQNGTYKGSCYLDCQRFCTGNFNKTEWKKFDPPYIAEKDFNIEYRIIEIKKN